MFVYSFKTSKTKIAVLALVIISVAIAAAMLIMHSGEPVANDGELSRKAENSQQREAFISQFGWKISDEPIEVSEVIIPEDFDAGYIAYAQMNSEQGFELEIYKGMRVKRWTYDILNYPGLENMTGTVQINLLVCDGVVIGGDVCSLESGGFLHGFALPENHTRATTSQPMSISASEGENDKKA